MDKINEYFSLKQRSNQMLTSVDFYPKLKFFSR